MGGVPALARSPDDPGPKLYDPELPGRIRAATALRFRRSYKKIAEARRELGRDREIDEVVERRLDRTEDGFRRVPPPGTSTIRKSNTRSRIASTPLLTGREWPSSSKR